MRKALLGAGIAAVSALALAGGSAVADTDTQERAVGAVIKMKFNAEEGPFFKGDKSIVAGQTLRIVNASNPNRTGPHTISLVEKSGLINSGAEAKECGKLAEGLCRRIFEAHNVNPKTFKVRKPLVDNGDEGWDAPFTDDSDGDSWYSETKGEKFNKPVSGEVLGPEGPGKLYFICIVHPGMQGKINVDHPGGP